MRTASARHQDTSLLLLMKRLIVVAMLGVAATGCGPELTVSNEEVLTQFTRHLPGLDEEVVFVLARADGSGSYKYVLREDGRQQAPGMVRREEAEMYRQRFGAMTPDLYVRTLKAAPEERIRVALYLHPPPLLESLAPILRGPPGPERQLARERLVAAMAEWTAPMVEELRSMRAEKVAAARSMPAVFAEVTAVQAVELSRHPAVASVMSGASSRPIEFGPPGTPGNSITVPEVDDVLNQSGYRG